VTKDDLARLAEGSTARRDATAGGTTEINFAEVLATAPSAVVVLDDSGRILYLNSQAERHLGSASDTLGRTVSDLLPSFAGSSLESALLASFKGSISVALTHFAAPDIGRVYSMSIQPHGKLSVVHFNDITRKVYRQRQQSAVSDFGFRALAAPTLEYTPLLEHAVQSVRESLGADFCACYEVDDAAESLALTAGSGWRTGSINAQSVEINSPSHIARTHRTAEPVVFHAAPTGPAEATGDTPLLAEHDVACGLTAAAHGGDGVRGVLAVYCKAERTFTHDDVHFLQSMANVLGGLVQRKVALSRLTESENRLRQAQRMEAVGRVAGGVAHDFNNLLTLIHSYSELAISELDGNEAVKSDVEQIRQASQRAAALTRQLLAFSRRQVLRPRELNLNEVVDGIQKMLQRVISSEVVLEVHQGVKLAPVFADPGQIEQVIVNLCLNARDALPSGGTLLITTRNLSNEGDGAGTLEGVPAGSWVELAVTDTGTGMSKEVVERIFEPYFTTRELGQGSGLGLSTVYGIVRQSDGYVIVESQVGTGTTMRILLPAHAVGTGTGNTPPYSHPPIPAKPYAILLVEDDGDVRAVTARILRGAGYEVLEARDGDEALTMFRASAFPIDLVITDLVMPRISGRELAAGLKRSLNFDRVMFISGYTEQTVVRQDMLPSGVPILIKPFSAARLLSAVEGAMPAVKG
jgi:signal transduction histidine kinase